MGVAGAAASNATIVLTGLSGLLAGAISMALGEWISVQSSRELNQRQIDLETEEIEASPEEEKQELILIYQAKGMEKQNAINLVEELFKDKQAAINALVHEELGMIRKNLVARPGRLQYLHLFCLHWVQFYLFSRISFSKV